MALHTRRASAVARTAIGTNRRACSRSPRLPVSPPLHIRSRSRDPQALSTARAAPASVAQGTCPNETRSISEISPPGRSYDGALGARNRQGYRRQAELAFAAAPCSIARLPGRCRADTHGRCSTARSDNIKTPPPPTAPTPVRMTRSQKRAGSMVSSASVGSFGGAWVRILKWIRLKYVNHSHSHPP